MFIRSICLGLMLCVAMTSGVSAQSSSKKNSRSADRQMAKMKKREITKLTTQIAKENFSPAKLTASQKSALKKLVGQKYEEISKLDKSMERAIPSNKAKELQAAYKKATRGGMAHSEAIMESIASIGLAEMVQQKIGKYNSSRNNLISTIRDQMMDKLDDKQRMAIKEAMTAMDKTDSAGASDSEEMAPKN